jgi:SAM-dependent methyltransferase
MHQLARLTILAIVSLGLVACDAALEATDAPPAAVAAGPQKPATAPDPGKIERPTSDPYHGDLSIFEKEGRAEALQIDRVMDLLGIEEGSAVADLGAGSGWFTVRAAARAGATGTVYAVDISEEAIRYIDERAKKEGLANVRTVLGTEDDPKLAPSSVDAVLILKTYHEFSEPVRIMRRVATALRPGGRVGIIDRNGEGDDHGVAEKVVVEEMKRAGFELAERYDFVKDGMDYFLVFRKSAARPTAAVSPRR